MKGQLKKTMTCTMATLAAMGLLGGCGNEGKDTASTQSDSAENVSGSVDSSSGTEQTGAKSEASYADYANGFEREVTIQIPVFDRAFEGWNVTDNYYTRWVQSEFGDKYNIKVEYTPITRSEQVNDYMQMLASGKAPDIIFHYDMPQELAYYGEGAMQKLDLEEIIFYAPTYWNNMKETIETYGKVDDGYYFFFADRPDAYNGVTLIRQDWLDQVNMDVPQTLEELNAVLLAWKEAGLGNGGGCLIQNSFTYDYPFRQWPVDEKERALYSDLAVAAFTWEPSHQFLKNMNYQYNNGLIDTEFYLNTDDAATQADFVSGKSGLYEFNISSATTVLDSLVKNDPHAKVSLLPMSAKSPTGYMPQTRAFWPFGLIMGINHSTSDEERAAVWMYMEWLSQPENLFYFQNGIEGVNYTLDEDGLAVKTEGFEGESKLSNNNNKDYWCLVTETAEYQNEELNYKANISNWAPVGYEYIIEGAYEDFVQRQPYSTPDVLFSQMLPVLTEYKSDLTEKFKELYVKCVMAPEEQFEATYEAACQEYLEAGYQAVLDEKQKAIDGGNYN